MNSDYSPVIEEQLDEAPAKARAAKRNVKIGLLGPFGGGNLGDAAIQQAVIEHIRQAFEAPQIFGYSMYPKDTEERHGIPSFPIGRDWTGKEGPIVRAILRFAGWLGRQPVKPLRRLERWVARLPLEYSLIQQSKKHLEHLDALFISGGGQLDDYFGGPFSHPYTLLKFTYLARKNGAKVFYVSVGAGPLDHWLSIRFVRWALSMANYRSFRDERSRQYLAERGFFRDDPVYPDLAHSLPVERYRAQALPFSDGKRVALGPMGYFAPQGWPRVDEGIYLGYLNKLAEFANWLLERGYQISLIPGEAVHDRSAILDFLTIMEERFGRKVDDNLCFPDIQTVDQLMYTLAGVDLVVAARLHNVLLAMVMDKPVLATSYHQKIDELMKDTGQEQYCLPIDRFAVETLRERFEQLEANRQTSQDQIRARVQQYRQALEAQYERIFELI